MDEEPPAPDLVAEGIRLFNEGYFFEAHEIWEEQWRRDQGPSHLFLQGLIQVAAGLHHYQNGNVRGAAALLRKALDKLQRYPARYLDIDAEGLVNQVEGARALLEEPSTGDEPRATIRFPKISR